MRTVETVDRLAMWWATASRGGVRAVLAVDGALAVTLGALAELGAADAANDRGLRLGVAGFALVGVAAGGLVLHRVWPVAALGVSLAATLAYLALGNPYSSILQLASVAAYSVGAWCANPVSLVALAAAVGVYIPVAWWGGGTPWPAFGVGPLAVVWLVVPWLVGTTVRGYRGVAARATDAERREHVYRERLRIAQEVHDVVGHSLAVINMQAGVGLHVWQRRPERAAEALRAVRQTSSHALEELRATLAPLEAPEPEGRPGTEPDRRPVAHLARIPELVEAVNQVGVEVTLTVRGPRRMLPAAVELAAYRIVQEALTNVVRHAAADRATVRVAYGQDGVSVTISDNGRGPAPGSTPGRGLIGMRERVAGVGGTFSVGARADGGFEVHAVLPVAGAGDGTWITR
ncbi:sensor histidine kinase [Micromonospora sp. URMC 103]|uniref:sensor histidine kinase n=1 Tax=Micromonospora sp. URMC 103 TaxID=3423406 RepID=UPI003F1B0748